MTYGKRRGLLVRLGIALALLAALGVSQVVGAQNPGGGQRAHAILRDLDGNVVGVASFSPRGGKVLVATTAHDLPPGFHGFHVHAVGTCDPATAFTSAGPHFNPTGQVHPHHAGDLPVLLVNGDGTALLATATDRFAVADLFDDDGSALVVHALPDNYANIPERYAAAPDPMTLEAGDSGLRIACGVIENGG